LRYYDLLYINMHNELLFGVFYAWILDYCDSHTVKCSVDCTANYFSHVKSIDVFVKMKDITDQLHLK